MVWKWILWRHVSSNLKWPRKKQEMLKKSAYFGLKFVIKAELGFVLIW